MVLEQIILATVLVSLVSLVGIFLLGVKVKIEPILFFLVSFATGTLLGAAFFDLLPEAIRQIQTETTLLLAFVGLMVFFALEKIILWHHHHDSHSRVKEGKPPHEKPVGYLNLIGDGLHNFFDGVAIAAAFIASPAVGIATTLAITLHEIPQEIGDFSLLLSSGFTVKKALLFNLLVGLTAVAGGILFFYFSNLIANIQSYALAFTAGMFLYIATVDLVPELHKETKISNSIAQLLLILLGAATIWIIATTLKV